MTKTAGFTAVFRYFVFMLPSLTEQEPARLHAILNTPDAAAFARPRFAAGNGGVKQLHQVWPLRVVAVGCRQQSVGFVERQQVLVLKENGNFPKPERLRRRSGCVATKA